MNLQLTDTPVLLNSYRSIDPKQVVTKRVSTSGVVYSKPCWVLWIKVYCPKVTQWVVPDDMQDPDEDWVDEDKARDENLVTGAYCVLPLDWWSSILVLKLNEFIWCTGIAIYSRTLILENTLTRLFIFDGENWIYNSEKWCAKVNWDTLLLSDIISTDRLGIMVYNHTETGDNRSLVYEIRFIHILDTKLLLRDGFTSQGKPVIDICPKWEDVENIVFKKPIKFNKGIYANLAPAGSYAEFGFVPV